MVPVRVGNPVLALMENDKARKGPRGQPLRKWYFQGGVYTVGTPSPTVLNIVHIGPHAGISTLAATTLLELLLNFSVHNLLNPIPLPQLLVEEVMEPA